MAKIEKALAMLAGGGSVGEDFFELATAALVQGLGCRWAGISCLSDDKKSVRLLASSGVEAPLDPGLFSLKTMPVAALYADPSLGQLHITDDLAARFPKYRDLLGVDPQRFSAAIFSHADGRPAGHMFIIDDEMVTRDAEAWQFFDLVCGRVGAEYSLRSGFAGNTWLDKLVDGTGTALVVTDTSGQIVLANDTYGEWAGFPGGADMIGGNVEQWTDPDDWVANKRVVSGLLQQGPTSAYECQLRDRHGVPRQVVAVAAVDKTPAGTHIVALMRDNKTRNDTNRARLESEARLKAVIDNAPFSIILKDGQGRYVAMNRQGEKWMGTTIAEAAGKFPDAIRNLNSGELDRTRDLEVLNEGRIVGYEVDGTVDGSQRTFWATKFPVMGVDGQPMGLGTIVYDVTDRKQTEVLLQKQMDEAEKSSDSKTRFLAAASHDLRQPLHSMELMLEILARMVQEPGQQELVADIAQAANIAAGLLNPLLDFSRLEAGMVQPEIEEFPIATLLRDMDVRFRPQVEKAGLELRIVPSNAVIRSDPVLLSLIVGNFLSNAERYTETGRLLLGCRRHGDALRIEVWDTGPGIESEHLNSIFEEFHQLDTATRDRDKGLGLGLAIVKAQASLLRHEVRVSTRLGRGSTFSIEVPLIGATAQPAPIMDADAVRPDFLAGRRMLILEDNLGLQRATKALLERWGGEVVLAANSSEAMNVIATDPAMLDLIIADYHLEDSDNGVDTVLQIRDQLDYDVPAIIVTADISNDSLRHADKNAFPLLQKPFRPAALRLAIAQSILENVQL
ncbi:MAG: PAS domain S-box protein [Rhodospirillaceae bacterium]|jgi:two-component system, sensor histidine kinase|nr:PAS domain S-box protein [Rhodospirillaceae bacterium]